jgi:hypothetical protein
MSNAEFCCCNAPPNKKLLTVDPTLHHTHFTLFITLQLQENILHLFTEIKCYNGGVAVNQTFCRCLDMYIGTQCEIRKLQLLILNKKIKGFFNCSKVCHA